MLTGSTRSDRCDYLREQYQRGTVWCSICVWYSMVRYLRGVQCGTVYGVRWGTLVQYGVQYGTVYLTMITSGHNFHPIFLQLNTCLPSFPTQTGVTGRKTERLDCREGRKEAPSVRSFPPIFFLGCLVLPQCFQNVASAVTPPSYNSTLVNSSSEKV